jgi:hypothetical protein
VTIVGAQTNICHYSVSIIFVYYDINSISFPRESAKSDGKVSKSIIVSEI